MSTMVPKTNKKVFERTCKTFKNHKKGSFLTFEGAALFYAGEAIHGTWKCGTFVWAVGKCMSIFQELKH